MLAAEYVGHVVGGWEYVGAAYGLTFGGLVVYALSLYRRRKERP